MDFIDRENPVARAQAAKFPAGTPWGCCMPMRAASHSKLYDKDKYIKSYLSGTGLSAFGYFGV